MKHTEFSIGMKFVSGDKRWRCTDIGARVIVAICLDERPEDESWYSGPPYAVAELVFDEYDMEACEPADQAESK